MIIVFWNSVNHIPTCSMNSKTVVKTCTGGLYFCNNMYCYYWMIKLPSDLPCEIIILGINNRGIFSLTEQGCGHARLGNWMDWVKSESIMHISFRLYNNTVDVSISSIGSTLKVPVVNAEYNYLLWAWTAFDFLILEFFFKAYQHEDSPSEFNFLPICGAFNFYFFHPARLNENEYSVSVTLLIIPLLLLFIGHQKNLNPFP